MFWGRVPEHLLQFWISNAGSQVICEVELYAHVLVRWELRHLLQDEMGISFIDNESARFALIKHTSPSPCMRSMIYALSFLDAVHPFGSWHERVPSKSNPADLPSRDEISKAVQLFGAVPFGDIQLPETFLNFLTTLKFDQQLAKETSALFMRRPPGAF